MTDFSNLTIHEASKLIQSKTLKALELTEACIGRAKKLNQQLNSFITICEEEAINRAKKVDKLIANGQKMNPLAGIPIGIKDLFSTKDIRTTAGSKVLENYVPVYDAASVARLNNANACIVGKTNLDAWAHGSSGENSDFGPTRNPHDLSRVPGGSSSGSAVSVSSGSSLAAMGTDTGGSIRLPASFCNVVGLKPTYGRVSRYGVIAMASSLDSIGHFTKNVEDSALVLSITAGKDLNDATMPSTKVDDYESYLERGIEGLKIGIPKEYFAQGLDKRIKEKIEKSVKSLEKEGARIETISLPNTEYAIACYYIIQPAEVSSNLARYDGIRYGSARQNFGDEAKRRIMLGTYVLSSGYYDAYYKKAMQIRTLIKKDF